MDEDNRSLEPQLELFKGWISPESNQSRTVDLFDAIPKYVFDKKGKTTEKIELLVREFEFRNAQYAVTITPATIVRNSKAIGVYPGEREEIVTRALLQMTVQQRLELRLGKDDKNKATISATFSLSQLRKQLQAVGHEYSLGQIDEALQVCHGATMNVKVEGAGKREGLSSGIFQWYATHDEDGDKTGTRSLRYVVFNPLVTSSILGRTTLAINFDRVMSLKSPLARWLYDRISHNFRQAVKNGAIAGMGYHLALSTILRESGVVAEARQRANIEKIRAVLAELKAQRVLDSICSHKEVLTYGEKPPRGPRPVVDAVWTLYPSRTLVDEIIAGNKEAKELR